MNEQPKEAIFVKIVDKTSKIEEQKKQIHEIDSKIRATQAKFQLPQGPALINGRWW
jgi:hypothetical protein|tara:strand:+ start:353 stop:520 length:168 start_codon:yes stop_codon:yes gene_type:complete